MRVVGGVALLVLASAASAQVDPFAPSPLDPRRFPPGTQAAFYHVDSGRSGLCSDADLHPEDRAACLDFFDPVGWVVFHPSANTTAWIRQNGPASGVSPTNGWRAINDPGVNGNGGPTGGTMGCSSSNGHHLDFCTISADREVLGRRVWVLFDARTTGCVHANLVGENGLYELRCVNEGRVILGACMANVGEQQKFSTLHGSITHDDGHCVKSVTGPWGAGVYYE